MSPDLTMSLFKQIYRTGLALILRILKYNYNYPLSTDSTSEHNIWNKFIQFVSKFDLGFFNVILEPLYKLESIEEIENFKLELESTASNIDDSNLFDVTRITKDNVYYRSSQKGSVPKILVGYFEFISLHMLKGNKCFTQDFFRDLHNNIDDHIKEIERQIILNDSIHIHKLDLGIY